MTSYARIESFLDQLVADGRTPGAGLAIAVRGNPVFERYAGAARTGVKAGPETIWPVASISKLYTAAAIMRMIEQGRLTLGLRVSEVIPEFHGDGRDEITLRQLLTHTSGLPYESAQHEERLASSTPVESMIDEVYAVDLEFAPGTRQKYSDFGYALAGRMAARVAGRSFETLVREEVLEPAGLQRTWLPAPVEIHDRVAHVDGTIGRTPETAMYNSAYGLGLAHPAFGAVASLSDLLRFGLLFDPHAASWFVSRAGLAVMTTDQTCSDDPGDSVIEPEGVIHPWGIGFMLKERAASPELVSRGSYGHGGATGCYLWIDPLYEVTIAFVSNRHYRADPADFMPRLDQMLNVVLAEITR